MLTDELEEEELITLELIIDGTVVDLASEAELELIAWEDSLCDEESILLLGDELACPPWQAESNNAVVLIISNNFDIFIMNNFLLAL